MNDARPSYRDFRRRLLAGLHLLGTFVKTQTSHATEMLGLLGFDFVVFDQEHAPLGQSALDVMILAARAANITPSSASATRASRTSFQPSTAAPSASWCRMSRRWGRPRKSPRPAGIAEAGSSVWPG